MGKLIKHCDLLYADLFDPRTCKEFAATPRDAVEALCDLMDFTPIIWEPACGRGHIAEVLMERGYDVIASDLYDWGYGIPKVDIFQQVNEIPYDIVTNPPEDCNKEFIEKAIDLVADGRKVAMFMKLALLQGARRERLYSVYPPKHIYVGKNRYCCPVNGDFASRHPRKDGFPHMWAVWEKGYNGPTTMTWF